MLYGFNMLTEARIFLRNLPKVQRRAIGHRMHLLCDDLAGDVKKLAGTRDLHRLRVGDFEWFSGFLMTLSWSPPSEIEKTLMNDVTAPLPRPVTLEALAQAYEAHALELAELRERLEDMEDIRVSEAAEARALACGEVPEPFDPLTDLDLTPEDFAEEAAHYAAERGLADGR